MEYMYIYIYIYIQGLYKDNRTWKLLFSVIPLQYVRFLPAENLNVMGSCLT